LPHLRLAVLDVDGTLKQAESPYQYIHRHLGLEHEADQNRALALAGQISYGEWLRKDVALWAGQPVERLRGLLAQNPYVAGAPELLRALKEAGVVVALVSAGFTLNTDPIMAEFDLDYALANELDVTEDGYLTGMAVNHVPEGGKAAFVRELSARLNIQQSEILAAGDTRGDLELFAWAGVRVAVAPHSDALRAEAHVIFERDLAGAVAWLREHAYI
jgi:phosphoserine phosphatase